MVPLTADQKCKLNDSETAGRHVTIGSLLFTQDTWQLIVYQCPLKEAPSNKRFSQEYFMLIYWRLCDFYDIFKIHVHFCASVA